MRKILLLAIFLIATAIQMYALPPDYRTGRLFDNPAVVAGNYTGFCQDKEGYIWIGTHRGLIRFDGNDYDIYRHDDVRDGSLSDSRVLDVLCDSNGRVWIATANGLNLYIPDTDTFKVISLPSKSFYGYIIAMAEQADGTVTFIASGVGLYVISFKDDEPVAVKYTYNTEGKIFNTIVCGDNGKMYMGVHEGIVYVMASNGNLTPVNVSKGEYIVDLSIESDGNVLVGSLNELYRINVKTLEVTHLQMDGKITINKLSNAHKDRVYIGTSDRGLWQVKAGSGKVEPATEIYSPFVNLSNGNIGAVFSAPEGNLWIGCNYKGVVMVPGKKMPFTYLKLDRSFPDFDGGISSLALWKGNVVAAIDHGRIGVIAPNGNIQRSVTLPFRALITSIELLDGDKALLGVAGDGVWQLDLITGVLSKYLDIPGKYPYVILARGMESDLYVGVHGEGLLRYDMATWDKEWIPFENGNEKGFSNSFITSMTASHDGKLWVCTYSGLACIDLKTHKEIEVNQLPFLNGTTFTAAPLKDGSVLAGTSQGLIHYDLKKGVIKKYTSNEGLTDNDVRSVVVDGKGGVWMGTVRGLSYMPSGSDKILSYYGGYGLVENQFNNAVYSKATDRVYAGNDLGMTSFRPEDVPSPGFDQEVKVSAFYLNGERLGRTPRDGRHEAIKGSFVKPEALYLPYKDNALTLRMSTMDYRDDSNISYMWRLGGKDDWIQNPPGENLIYLPHLDPGVYDFEVCAFENNVKSKPTLIKIHIASPWYLSIWAKMAYLIIFLALVWLGWTAFRKKRDERINDEKIKFFMDLSHDLRSPITLILSPLESLMKQPFDAEVKGKLKIMHRNVYRMMSLVNQMLDIRKLEKGKMNLYCKQTEINSFVGELVEMFRTQAEDKTQTLSFEGLPEERKIWLDRNNFDKILANIVSNAIKYTPKEGSVDVSLAVEQDARLGECLRVSVTDTGIGLDSKVEARIFERFYRVESDHTQSSMGFGIGLDLCRRLATLHHGVISGCNRDDGVRGSVFTLRIPLEEKYYAEEELKSGTSAQSGAERQIVGPPASPAGDLTSRPKVSTSGKYILFIDDDEEMRSYVSAQLGKIYKVKTAANGVEALKMIGIREPDIIISDVIMPAMDGLTLLKRLKSKAETNHIPVILLTSKVGVSDRMAGWERGADGYLGKPFNIDELEALVSTLLENRLRMKGKFSGAQETEGKIVSPEMKGNDEMLMERIMKVINQYIEDPQLNVEKLSVEVGVSRAHLHRKMKEMIGMTPSDYIRNIRLKQACELLKREDIEVTQVAYKIGFASQSHFSTHFKRYTGFSPSEYRAKNMTGT